MKLPILLIGTGVLLIVAAVFLFIQRSGQANEAYRLEREREQLAMEQDPEGRERYLQIVEKSSRANTNVRNSGVAIIACGGLGIGAAAIGLARLRKTRSSAPGSSA